MDQTQIDFFETFGFIKFPGLLKAEIGWITEEFEKVFPLFLNMHHDGSKRSMIVPFIDQNEKLSTLLDHPAIHTICTGLLGDDFNYMGSDGNYYVGDTLWHPDGQDAKRRKIKIALYLDPLDGSNGALRVIPGSHRLNDSFSRDVTQKVRKSGEYWGISGSEVPALALDTIPGDVVVFEHSTFHSSWGGTSRRRMFTMNLSERYKPDQLDELQAYVLQHAHYKRDGYYGDAMIQTATAQRRKHLEQVLSVTEEFGSMTSHLPELERA